MPLVCRSRRPQISGFTFGVISRSQFIGRRCFSDFSLRFVPSSLLSHLKFTILPSLSDTQGEAFSVSARDCAISSGKGSLSSSAQVWPVTTLGRLFEGKSLSASYTSESESFPIDGDFRFSAEFAVGDVWASPFSFNDLSDSPIVMFKNCLFIRPCSCSKTAGQQEEGRWY